MTDSRVLASVVGPALVALALTEPLNWAIFEQQSAAIVYLNGTILFIAGLALVRAHNRWVGGWPTLITATSWALLLGGLYRMIAPAPQQMQLGGAGAVMFGAIGAIGLVLTYQGYRRATTRSGASRRHEP